MKPIRIGSTGFIPRIASAPLKRYWTLLAGKSEDYSAEYRIVRPSDGQTRWINVIAKIERTRRPRAPADRRLHRYHRADGAGKVYEARALPPHSGQRSPSRSVTKLDRTRSFANQALCVDFLGLPAEEAIAFDWRKRLHPRRLIVLLQESIAA